MRVAGSSLLKMVMAATFCQSPAFAAKAEMPADQLFSFLARYYVIPPKERDRFTLSYCLLIDGRSAPGRFTLEVGAERKPLILDSAGCVEQLPGPRDLARHASVLMEDNAQAGEHQLAVNIGLRALIPPAREISAADCLLAIAQAEAGVKKAVARFGIDPKIRRVGFPGAGGGVAIMNDGRSVPLPLLNGFPIFDPAEMAAAQKIRLQREPSSVIFPDPILPLER